MPDLILFDKSNQLKKFNHCNPERVTDGYINYYNSAKLNVHHWKVILSSGGKSANELVVC
jgi:hypothetical protein